MTFIIVRNAICWEGRHGLVNQSAYKLRKGKDPYIDFSKGKGRMSDF